MLRSVLLYFLVLASLLASSACGNNSPKDEASVETVVVTTSMLESAAASLFHPDKAVEVISIVPPGTCPGHFDLSPRALPRIRSARLILVHDYQKPLADKIREVASGHDVNIMLVPSSGSLLIPANYLGLEAAIADRLIETMPGESKHIESQLKSINETMARLEEEFIQGRRKWENRRVVASTRQEAYARWLGLDVVGTFPPPDSMKPQVIEKLLGTSAEVVIGNLQEGTQAAKSVSERLGVPLVVFSNFPGAEGYGETYADLSRTNIARLEKALEDSAE